MRYFLGFLLATAGVCLYGAVPCDTARHPAGCPAYAVLPLVLPCVGLCAGRAPPVCPPFPRGPLAGLIPMLRRGARPCRARPAPRAWVFRRHSARLLPQGWCWGRRRSGSTWRSRGPGTWPSSFPTRVGGMEGQAEGHQPPEAGGRWALPAHRFDCMRGLRRTAAEAPDVPGQAQAGATASTSAARPLPSPGLQASWCTCPTAGASPCNTSSLCTGPRKALRPACAAACAACLLQPQPCPASKKAASSSPCCQCRWATNQAAGPAAGRSCGTGRQQAKPSCSPAPLRRSLQAAATFFVGCCAFIVLGFTSFQLTLLLSGGLLLAAPLPAGCSLPSGSVGTSANRHGAAAAAAPAQ